MGFIRKNYQQIDVMKGFAIISVVLLHSLHKDTLLETYAIYHIWQAVPLFMIIMGLNLGLTSSTKSVHFSSIFTQTYFLKKFSRIIVPLLLIYIVSIVAGLVAYWLTGENKIEFRLSNFIGVLPVTGPGNYFITLLLQTIFLLPLIRFFYRQRPYLTVLALVLLEVLFLLLSTYIGLFEKVIYLFNAALPRYFSAIAFGLALSGVVAAPFNFRKLLPLLMVAVASGVYLYQLLYNQVKISFIRPEWQTQLVLAFGYTALLVILLFRLLPNSSDNRILKFLAKLGKASYHIFLVQTVYFGIVTVENDVLQDVAICLALGFVFYKYESTLKLHRIIERKLVSAV